LRRQRASEKRLSRSSAELPGYILLRKLLTWILEDLVCRAYLDEISSMPYNRKGLLYCPA